MQRIRTNLSELGLSDDQNTRIDSILEDMAKQTRQLAPELRDLTPQERIQRLKPVLDELRTKVDAVLTAEQAQSLGQKMPGIFGARGGAGAGAAPPDQLKVVQQALGEFDLSPDQKQKISGLISQARQQIDELRLKANDGEPIGPRVQQIRADMRDKFSDILTPDQMTQLRELIQQRSAGAANRTATTRASGATGMVETSSSTADAAKPVDGVVSAVPAQAAALAVGGAAPDIRINELKGPRALLSSFKGRVLVIEFGSYSAPTFRDHAAAMEKLKGEVGTRASFLVIYTREAYPAGQWDIDRNNEQHISVQQAKDFTGREAEAEYARATLRITLPMAVDSMEDEAATAFGALPNGAVVIDKQGNLIARQQWTNIEGLRDAIEQASQK